MRYLVEVSIPHEPFNTYCRQGDAGQRIGRVLEATAPESVYFTERDGKRGAVLVYNLDSPSQVPAIAEPWFLTFNADCRIQVAMTPDDLKRAKLDEVGKKWGV